MLKGLNSPKKQERSTNIFRMTHYMNSFISNVGKANVDYFLSQVFFNDTISYTAIFVCKEKEQEKTQMHKNIIGFFHLFFFITIKACVP